MNAKKIILCAFLLLMFMSHVIGQKLTGTEQLIAKIDSIAKVKKIELAMAYKIAPSGTSTNQCITYREKFIIDGKVLILKDTYFDLDKLLYFEVNGDHFEFYF